MAAVLAELVPEVPTPLVGRIPVRNLWLLMLYASDLYKTRGMLFGTQDENPDEIPDLLGRILAPEVEKRRARGLTRGYRSVDATMSRVRGRINLFTTSRRQLLDRGMVACRYQELTFDTPRNRLVLYALQVLGGLIRNAELAARCRGLALKLKADGVSLERPSRQQMVAERLGSHDAQDRRSSEPSGRGLMSHV